MASPMKKVDSRAHSELQIRENETEKFLKEIDVCQKEIIFLSEQCGKEMENVKERYNLVRQPHFDKRAQIISKVPNFWQIAIKNHPNLNFILKLQDEDWFQYLIKLDAEEFKDITSGYRIHFYFKENPYFENTVLTKEFQFGSSGTLTSSSIPIRWKEERTDEPTCTKVYQRTFFAWYNDHLYPTSDFIANVIKGDLWQNPLQYFGDPVVVVIDDEEDQEIILIEDDEDETAE